MLKTEGKPNPHPERILKNVNEFESFDQKNLIGHAAWNAWPWKLHRIQTPRETRFELYNLETDPMESDDLLKKQSKKSKYHDNRFGKMAEIRFE
ncbi:MAG: hypothetical protein CM15mP130_2550 [Verrucomicrobiota bacterium]|nr:MAG: hypothetical protein CM15mP130_2550 [Verrucomicrobiota bacterium]